VFRAHAEGVSTSIEGVWGSKKMVPSDFTVGKVKGGGVEVECAVKWAGRKDEGKKGRPKAVEQLGPKKTGGRPLLGPGGGPDRNKRKQGSRPVPLRSTEIGCGTRGNGG